MAGGTGFDAPRSMSAIGSRGTGAGIARAVVAAAAVEGADPAGPACAISGGRDGGRGLAAGADATGAEDLAVSAAGLNRGAGCGPPCSARASRIPTPTAAAVAPTTTGLAAEQAPQPLDTPPLLAAPGGDEPPRARNHDPFRASISGTFFHRLGGFETTGFDAEGRRLKSMDFRNGADRTAAALGTSRRPDIDRRAASGALSICMEPPCSPTSPLTTARPRPEPSMPGAALVGLEERLAKAALVLGGDADAGVLDREQHAIHVAGPRKADAAAAGVNLMAFRSRLMSICLQAGWSAQAGGGSPARRRIPA